MHQASPAALRSGRFLLVPLLLAFATASPPALRAQDTKSNEGGDLLIAGFGSGPGQFIELRDITFDPAGNLYTLDGAKLDAKTKQLDGNLRVQKFDRSGELLATIDLRDAATGETLGDKNDPQRVAADAAGNVYVTHPAAGRVQQFGAEGKFLRSVELPRAMAVCVVKVGGAERVAVVPSRREAVKGQKGLPWLDGDKVVLLDAAGAVTKTVLLERTLENVQDLAADREGNFYVKAEPNAVYKFSPDGKLLKTLGGSPTTRAEDGSELLHTVAVDSKGNVYSMAWGNPGYVTRFDVNGKTVTQRGGQFKWANPWSVHSSYCPIAIDPDDRLWAAATHRPPTKADVHHASRPVTPAVIRAKADFLENPKGKIRTHEVRTLGFKPSVKCGLPYNVSYEAGKPVPMEYVVAPANRAVDRVAVTWRAFDAEKAEVARGTLDVPLENGKEVRTPFTFTPPKFGAYLVLAQASSPLGPLPGVGEHVGVTPRFPNVRVLEPGESTGGWNDHARQMWTGLPNVRIHPAKDEKGLAKTDAEIALAEREGTTFLVQLVDNMKHLTPEFVRLVATRYKGRVKHYEVCNEPNFSASIDEYFKGHQMAYRIIKEVDPQAKVMGPGTVNMDLNWLRRLYELGFKDVSDVVSLHDYEGHESITPEHWVWKYAQVREIMAQNGDAAKPLWQTERAISAVRGLNFQGLVQAIRCCLHRDLLETFGVPSEHNNHYYLNQAGYSSVPSYAWSHNGPHPAALALRTRHALTSALGRTYAGKLDFGPVGNTYLLGVRYAGKDGSQTVVLRNLGTRPVKQLVGVSGPGTFGLADAWGNATQVSPEGAGTALTIGQLPLYVTLAKGQELKTVGPLDFGRNVAPRARWTYTGTVERAGDMSLLANGVYETHHGGNPNGDTNGHKIWTADLPPDGQSGVRPQTLEASFDRPQTIDKVIVRGVRADNTFCALLEYDLDVFDGKAWRTIEQVRNAMPPSEEGATADAKAVIWMDDTNLYVHAFPPTVAERVRIVARRATHGYMPDARGKAYGGNLIAQKLMLREVEIFSPNGAVTLTPTLEAAATAKPGRPDAQSLKVRVANAGEGAVTGTLMAFGPNGWAVGDARPVDVSAKGDAEVTFTVTPPVDTPVGRAAFDVELRDKQGGLVTTSFATLDVKSSVELMPQWPTPAQGATQTFTAIVTNTSAAPASGTARLALRGGGRTVPPVEAKFGPIEPGKTETVTFAVPGVDALSGRWEASYTVNAGGTVSTVPQSLASQRWSLLGPFPRDFHHDYGPESRVDLSKTYVDMVGQQQKWVRAGTNAKGMVDLAAALKPTTEVCAYAVTYVDSPVARKALFSVGTDDGGKGWINGKPVYADDGSHGATPGQQKIPVELKQGRNEVLLKVTQGSDAWGFYFDLLDAETGRALTDATYGPR